MLSEIITPAVRALHGLGDGVSASKGKDTVQFYPCRQSDILLESALCRTFVFRNVPRYISPQETSNKPTDFRHSENIIEIC